MFQRLSRFAFSAGVGNSARARPVSPARMARNSKHRCVIGASPARAGASCSPSTGDAPCPTNHRRPHRSFRRRAAHGRSTLSRCAVEAHRRAAAAPSLVSAAALSCVREAGRDPQRAAREEPARYRGAAARETGRAAAQRISIRPFARRARPTGAATIFSIRAWARPAAASGATCRSQHTVPDTANLLVPNPRTVSRELMTREQFQPATILNLLAAAWIQFMVHDWFVHKRSKTEFIDMPTAPGDDFGAPSACPARCPTCAGGFDAPAGLREPQQPLVGCVADLWMRSRDGRQAAHRSPTASCASSPQDCCRSIPTPACTSPASPTTGGSAWRCCTRSSPSSTTTSATCSRTTIRAGPTNSSSARRS